MSHEPWLAFYHMGSHSAFEHWKLMFYSNTLVAGDSEPRERILCFHNKLWLMLGQHKMTNDAGWFLVPWVIEWCKDLSEPEEVRAPGEHASLKTQTWFPHNSVFLASLTSLQTWQLEPELEQTPILPWRVFVALVGHSSAGIGAGGCNLSEVFYRAALGWGQIGGQKPAGECVSVLIITQTPITGKILYFKTLIFPLQNQRKLLFGTSEKVSCFREIRLSWYPEGHDIFPVFDYIKYIKYDLNV